MTRRSSGEGSFSLRPDGRWMYQISVSGRRITKYGRTKTEAKAKVDALLPQLGAGNQRATLSQIFEDWIEDGHEAHRLAPSTFDQYQSLLRNRVLIELGPKRIEAITKSAVADFFRAMEGSASTKRSTYAAAVHLFEYAKDRGLVGANVVRQVKRPAASTPVARTIAIEDALRLLAAARGHRWEVAAWLGLGAGIRRGEMLGLLWDDVDLPGAQIRIAGNVTRTSAGLHRGAPKTRRGLRTVPMPDPVVDALRHHRRSQIAEQLLAGSVWVESGYVLTNHLGGGGEPRSLSRVWAGWAVRAGLEDKGTHAGRHFAATSLVSSGHASPADVAAMLGHDPAVLMATYAAAVVEGQRSAAAALGSVLVTPRGA